MHLFVDAVCSASTPAWSRLAAPHVLGGLALALLGGRVWFALVVAAFELVLLTVSGRVAWASLAVYAGAGALVGVAQRWLLRLPREPLEWWRVPLLGVLAVAGAWRIDDRLCSNSFPLGLVRAFALYVGGAFIIFWWWMPTGGPVPLVPNPRREQQHAHVKAHATHLASALAVYASFAVLFAPAYALAALGAALALVAGERVAAYMN